ncbi:MULTISPECIES: hypothetical protein [Acidithiobacillus]|jgi:uncharacterized membrane protein|uniref:hypothetical protein n=1 Tax=Acidithiobacillus TaxID=119977 RepID=UPI0004E23CD7|nr:MULTISPECIES: hypothetical protein [Acidithiobacillus]MDD2750503.1 hypothetical protein [Acidithiobacillus sp.]MDD5278763.1 hypothetical protein [Acidithiobacillus sp.]
MQNIKTVIKTSWGTWKQAKLGFSIIAVLQIAASVLQIYIQEGMRNFNANGGTFQLGYLLIILFALLVPATNVATNALAVWVFDRDTHPEKPAEPKLQAILHKMGDHGVQKTIAFFFIFQTIIALDYLVIGTSGTIAVSLATFVVTALELFLIPLAVAGEMTWVTALKLSPKILVREWLPILILWVLSIVTVVLSAVTFGILLIVAVPIYEIALLVIARQYADQKNPSVR